MDDSRIESKKRVLKDLISFMRKHEKGSIEEKRKKKMSPPKVEVEIESEDDSGETEE